MIMNSLLGRSWKSICQNKGKSLLTFAAAATSVTSLVADSAASKSWTPIEQRIQVLQEKNQCHLLVVLDKTIHAHLPETCCNIIDNDACGSMNTFLWLFAYGKTKQQQQQPKKPLHLLLHTNGGDRASGHAISRMIADYPETTTAFVPCKAFSVGTVLALSCDNLVMNEAAYLSPIDTQLSFVGGGGMNITGSVRSHMQSQNPVVRHQAGVFWNQDRAFIKGIADQWLLDRDALRNQAQKTQFPLLSAFPWIASCLSSQKKTPWTSADMIQLFASGSVPHDTVFSRHDMAKWHPRLSAETVPDEYAELLFDILVYQETHGNPLLKLLFTTTS